MALTEPHLSTPLRCAWPDYYVSTIAAALYCVTDALLADYKLKN